jgi:hypothetical protein
MGRLSSPSPEAAHKQAKLQGRNLDMAPMGYMETLSSGSGRVSMSDMACHQQFIARIGDNGGAPKLARREQYGRSGQSCGPDVGYLGGR